jgi:hypothetical protein
MRLSDEDLKAGWLHPKRLVRSSVATHFSKSLTRDPAIVHEAIRSVEEFGWKHVLVWPHLFCDLPLADDVAVEWVCAQVERVDDGAPSANQKGHLATMLVGATIASVERYRPRILSLQSLSDRKRKSLATRLELSRLDPDECWHRLVDHCRRAAGVKDFADADIPHAELLLEPLVRAGDRFVPHVIEVLGRPRPADDEPGPDDWLLGMAIILAGHLRCEETAPLLWTLWEVDWDWFNEEVMQAMIRIGTPSVVRLAEVRYPNAEWHVRNYAHNLFERIRCDEAVEAIEAVIDREDDEHFRGQIGVAASAQFDDRLVPLALRILNEDPDDPERGAIRENLVAFSHLGGLELPERDEWEREIDATDERMISMSDPETNPLLQLLLRKPIDDEPLDDFDGEPDDLFLDAPAKPTTPVGRNEPCPCGSGKKYKKCCLRGSAG